MLNFNKSIKKNIFTLVCATALSASTSYAGGPATSSIPITATVIPSCTITANPLPFGDYDLTLKDAQTDLNVTCTNQTPYEIGLDAGLGGNSVTARAMNSTPVSGNTLQYALYKDAGRTDNWGDGFGTSATLPGTGTSALQVIPVYGRLPAGQASPIGAYEDTVVATIYF